MDITIRNATIKDLDVLRQIDLRSFEANIIYDSFTDENWVHGEDAKKYFTTALTNEDYYPIIAEIAGTPAGFLILSHKIVTYRTVKTVEIDVFAVLPEYQSKGVGAKLVEHAKKWAKEHGFDTIYVSAYFKNKRGLTFYEREKFSPISVALEATL